VFDVIIDDYNDYLNSIDFSSGSDEDVLLQQNVTDAFNKQNEAMIGLISAGSISAGVWLRNIIDIK
jgi:hypothetical protein